MSVQKRMAENRKDALKGAENVSGEAALTQSPQDLCENAALVREPFSPSLPGGPNYKELGRRGGVASGAARRRKRELKEAADELLALNCVNSEGLKALQALGQAEGDNTAAIMAAILAAAMRGNLDAVKFLRDLTAVKAAPEDRKVEFCFDRFEDITG